MYKDYNYANATVIRKGPLNMERVRVIEARDIHKKIGTTDIIRGVSFRVYAGEVVSIMGPSGSGKSTLLYCLAGIIYVDEGDVMYMGKSIVSMSKNALAKLRRTDFGFIFQLGELVPELPVRDNVALPLLLRGEKKRDAYRAADAWLSTVGLKDVARSLPQTLSGGETQRAAIARAMAINPKLIFADEPTGSLDSVNSKNIMELIVLMAHQYNAAVVMVTHSEEVADFSDRIVRLRDGQIEGMLPETQS